MNKRDGVKRTIAALAITVAAAFCLTLIAPGISKADVAATGDYNWKDVNYYVVVDSEEGALALYYGPGLEYGSDGFVENGTELHILSTADNFYDQLHWGNILYEGNQYWIPLNDTRWIGGDPEALVMEVYRYDDKTEYERYSFSIPFVQLNSEEIHAFNQTLYDTLWKEIEPVEKALREGAALPTDALIDVEYAYFENDDILSLVIGQFWANGWLEAEAYNFSISEKRVLDQTEFLAAIGYTEDSYAEAVRDTLKQEFDWEYGDLDEKTEAYQQAYEDTLSPENIQDTRPFLQYGDLSFLGKMYLIGEDFPYRWQEFEIY